MFLSHTRWDNIFSQGLGDLGLSVSQKFREKSNSKKGQGVTGFPEGSCQKPLTFSIITPIPLTMYLCLKNRGVNLVLM